jgi:hypothetical protein
MIVKFKENDFELKYTFNSFKYMEEFDITELEQVDKKPFKALSLARIMLFGAFNHNPSKIIGEVDIDKFLEEYMEENSIVELITSLVDLMQKSDFFKSLQKKMK